jgi:hypothetical protein
MLEYTPFKPEASMSEADEWDAEAYDIYIYIYIYIYIST